jgi:hypothetical protein
MIIAARQFILVQRGQNTLPNGEVCEILLFGFGARAPKNLGWVTEFRGLCHPGGNCRVLRVLLPQRVLTHDDVQIESVSLNIYHRSAN